MEKRVVVAWKPNFLLRLLSLINDSYNVAWIAHQGAFANEHKNIHPCRKKTSYQVFQHFSCSVLHLEKKTFQTLFHRCCKQGKVENLKFAFAMRIVSSDFKMWHVTNWDWCEMQFFYHATTPHVCCVISFETVGGISFYHLDTILWSDMENNYAKKKVHHGSKVDKCSVLD